MGELWGKPHEILPFWAKCEHLAAQGVTADGDDNVLKRVWLAVKREIASWDEKSVIAIFIILAVIALAAFREHAKSEAAKAKKDMMKEAAEYYFDNQLEPESKHALLDSWADMARYIEHCKADNNVLEAARVATELEQEQQLANDIHKKADEVNKHNGEWVVVKMQIDGLRRRNKFRVPTTQP